jgi:DNA-binding NarL/FixJ family response regulator
MVETPIITLPVNRILVIEDHPIVRAGLVHVLNENPGFSVCAATGDGESALALAREHKPEIILLDLMLEGRDSLSLIAEFLRGRPATKVLVLSMMHETIYAERALHAGAVGYIMKSAETSEVMLALRNIVEGRLYLSPKIFISIFRGILPHDSGKTGGVLSNRELQIYQLIGAGIPNREIAAKLTISVKTVEAHRENIKSKLGLHDARELSHAAQDFIATLRC